MPAKSPRKSEAEAITQAEAIYQAYPRKVKRPEALKAIRKAMSAHAPKFLLERTQAFAAAITPWQERQFIPHPARGSTPSNSTTTPRTGNHPAKAAPRNPAPRKPPIVSESDPMTTDDLRPEPAAIMAEKALLSCMMQEPAQFIARGLAAGLGEDSFSTPAMREIFRSVVDDFHAHGDLDLTASVQRRQTEGILQRMGGTAPSRGGFQLRHQLHRMATMARPGEGSARAPHCP